MMEKLWRYVYESIATCEEIEMDGVMEWSISVYGSPTWTAPLTYNERGDGYCHIYSDEPIETDEHITLVAENSTIGGWY